MFFEVMDLHAIDQGCPTAARMRPARLFYVARDVMSS